MIDQIETNKAQESAITDSLKQLNSLIDVLYQEHGMVMTYAGFEWEDMNLDEVACLKQLGTDNIPLLMKLSGLEARAEMRHLCQVGADIFLAPMVESPFGLQKFVTTAQQVCKAHQKSPRFGVMLESIACADQINSIVSSPYFEELEVTILGRWDLAQSMQTEDVDDQAVMDVCRKIVDAVVAKNTSISIGGFINPFSVNQVKKQFGADKVNTIHVVLEVDKCPNLSHSVELAIHFVKAFYKHLQLVNPQRASVYQTRIDISDRKLVHLSAH